MNIEQLEYRYRLQFGKDPSYLYFSPGRVNLIGEHTDYNGGSVLPAAIDVGTYFAAAPNASGIIDIVSDAFERGAPVDLETVGDRTASGHWHDYVVGALQEFSRRGLTGPGLDVRVAGDLPRNSGLSSSASFTVGVISLLNGIWDCHLELIEMVRMARRVENRFIGLQCGIMDPFAVAMGRSGHCIRLHCESLEWSWVPLPASGVEILITDSRVPRRLSASGYNQRRIECERASSRLAQQFGTAYLCAATREEVEACDALRDSPVELKRARHVVSEQERVDQSATALAAGDLARFGKLMVASHRSLRDDFEVSCPELDLLVDTALEVPGVLGSRMTGAGFGGCTVSLVETGAVAEFESRVRGVYSQRTPYEANVFRCRAGDGVKRLGPDPSGVVS
jgi:galactokinase